eukprot:1156675-Pelagomonas_calceolata.AAC.1
MLKQTRLHVLFDCIHAPLLYKPVHTLASTCAYLTILAQGPAILMNFACAHTLYACLTKPVCEPYLQQSTLRSLAQGTVLLQLSCPPYKPGFHVRVSLLGNYCKQ